MKALINKSPRRTLAQTTIRIGRLFFLAMVAAHCALSMAASGREESATRTSANDGPQAVERSVVKIFSTARYPDVFRPWTKQPAKEVTGTGVVIGHRRILSNAHVVRYASQVQVQANETGDKILATVEAVANDMDLAVLKLEDETFFDTHPPLAMATSLPRIKDPVMAYGFPQGGSSLSITKGIVSRIEFVPYNLSGQGLRIQVDAPINPGNSGGPVVEGNQMIGLTFAFLGNAQNVGYIIPCEEIELFLEDIADGHYDGKPVLVDALQPLANPALRGFLKLDKSIEGMIVHRPASRDPAYPLKQWDVITRIGDAPLDDEGMVQAGANLRVNFRYLVSKLARAGRVPLTLVRQGKMVQVELPLCNRPAPLIPALDGDYPSYFICGPLVLSTATWDLVGDLTRGDAGTARKTLMSAAGSHLIKRLGERPTLPGESMVVVPSPFFPHKLANGYNNPALQVVTTVNGIRVKNLAHLVEIIRDSREEFLVFEFDTRGSETLVFPREQLLASTDEILADNGVRNQGSMDLLKLWTRQGPASQEIVQINK